MVARAGRQDRLEDDPRPSWKGLLIRASTTRPLVLALAVASLGFYAWLAIEAYRAQRDPEGYLSRRGPLSSFVAPPAKAWNEAAAAHVTGGLAVLNDRALPPADRLRTYRAELATAERLLVESLRAQPAQAKTLAQLAAVRWELEAPMDEDASEKHLAMMEVASEMAPSVPRVQFQIGTLLLKMGRRQDAEIYLRKAAELDPALTDDVVLALRNYLYTPEEMLRALPPGPATLIALEESFVSEGEVPRYLEALEPAMKEPTARLLSVYADACLASGDASRLAARLDELGEMREPALEAERRIQSARARLAQSDPAGAVHDARDAAALVPDDARIAGLRGQIALAANEPGDAIDAFKKALGLLARQGASAGARARLYRDIGRSEERLGNPGRAYDAYRRALELDPEEPFAGRRVSEMRKAAGMPSLP